MEHGLTISDSALRQLTEWPSAVGERLFCGAGLCRLPHRFEWLVHDVGVLRGRTEPQGPSVLVVRGASEAELRTAAARSLSLCPLEGQGVMLIIGVGAAGGRVGAARRGQRGLEPLEALSLVGPHMHRLALRAAIKATGRDDRPACEFAAGLSSASRHDPEQVWSRTIGALGEPTWRRLTALRFAVVGCGRSGSLVAGALARLGVLHITLIDHDTTEPHNLGEMDAVDWTDVGQPKVHAVADELRRQSLRAEATILTVREPAFSLSALAAIKWADMLFCCVDTAAARLATGFLAAIYLKPLLDIGTGIFQGFEPWQPGTVPAETAGPTPRQMGADVRLILPGRCLACLGGIGGSVDLAATLSHPEVDADTSNLTRSEWRNHRAGSLRSLNGVAVHLALRLLEDFVAGRLVESTWLHLDFSDVGLPNLEHRSPGRDPSCPLCPLTGRGDGRLSEFRALARSLPRPIPG